VPGPEAGIAEQLAAATAAGVLSASDPLPSPTADTPEGLFHLSDFPYPFLDSDEEFMYTKAKWVPMEVPKWVLAIPGGIQAYTRGQSSAWDTDAARRARAGGAAPAH